MNMETERRNIKKRDRMAVILYYCYFALLILGVVLVGRIIYIQCFWSLDKDVEKFYLPRNIKSKIEPERGAIIANDGRLLAISTPMYQLYMDCTVRKDISNHRKSP
jgi:cell division protein FtsI (penicillin-binding protein 3)